VTSNNAMHVQTQSAASGEVSQPVMLSLPYLFQIYRKAVYLPFTNTSCGTSRLFTPLEKTLQLKLRLSGSTAMSVALFLT